MHLFVAGSLAIHYEFEAWMYSLCMSHGISHFPWCNGAIGMVRIPYFAWGVGLGVGWGWVGLGVRLGWVGFKVIN